jgi:hypothetical protein
MVHWHVGHMNWDAHGLSQNPCTNQQDGTTLGWHGDIDEEMMPRWHASFVFWFFLMYIGNGSSCHNPTRNNIFDNLDKANELLIVDCKHSINRTIFYLGSPFENRKKLNSKTYHKNIIHWMQLLWMIKNKYCSLLCIDF